MDLRGHLTDALPSSPACTASTNKAATMNSAKHSYVPLSGNLQASRCRASPRAAYASAQPQGRVGYAKQWKSCQDRWKVSTREGEEPTGCSTGLCFNLKML